MTEWPASRWRSSVPPQPISTSSGWAPDGEDPHGRGLVDDGAQHLGELVGGAVVDDLGDADPQGTQQAVAGGVRAGEGADAQARVRGPRAAQDVLGLLVERVAVDDEDRRLAARPQEVDRVRRREQQGDQAHRGQRGRGRLGRATAPQDRHPLRRRRRTVDPRRQVLPRGARSVRDRRAGRGRVGHVIDGSGGRGRVPGGR